MLKRSYRLSAHNEEGSGTSCQYTEHLHTFFSFYISSLKLLAIIMKQLRLLRNITSLQRLTFVII